MTLNKTQLVTCKREMQIQINQCDNNVLYKSHKKSNQLAYTGKKSGLRLVHAQETQAAKKLGLQATVNSISVIPGRVSLLLKENQQRR